MKNLAITIALSSLSGLCASCTSAPAQGCTTQLGAIWSNGLDWSNGLAWSNGLLASALSDRSVDQYLAPGALDDPQTRSGFEYLVRCALGPDQRVHATIAGQTVTFPGKIGLAREWADAACGETCQRWVSACLLSSVNHEGEHVAIVLDGAHPVLLVLEPVPVDLGVRFGADQRR
jgi:hypothetical protein